MAKGVLLARSTCNDGAREDEFNSWYTHTHVPDVLEGRGFTGARRYVDPYGGTPRYLTIYEAEEDNLMESAGELRRISKASWAAGRHIECVDPGSLGVYRYIDPSGYEPIGEVGNGPYENAKAVDRDRPSLPTVAKTLEKGVFLVATNCTNPAREEEFNRWYSHMHIPDLSAAQGFIRADRYRCESPDAAPAAYLTIYEYEGDIFAALNDMLRIARSIFASRHIDCIEGAPGGGLYQQIDTAAYPRLPKLDYPKR